MRHESKAAAIACAVRMNDYRVGMASPIIAALYSYGWATIELSPYSQGSVIEYADAAECGIDGSRDAREPWRLVPS